MKVFKNGAVEYEYVKIFHFVTKYVENNKKRNLQTLTLFME